MVAYITSFRLLSTRTNIKEPFTYEYIDWKALFFHLSEYIVSQIASYQIIVNANWKINIKFKDIILNLNDFSQLFARNSFKFLDLRWRHIGLTWNKRFKVFINRFFDHCTRLYMSIWSMHMICFTLWENRWDCAPLQYFICNVCVWSALQCAIVH